MQPLNGLRPLELLLVEDNPGDVDLVRSYIRKRGLVTNLTVARDGSQAIGILRSRANHPPQSDLILLDLNLPKIGGMELLKRIKEDATLKHIPVIILTSSTAPDDIATAYSLGANCFVTKSLDFSGSARLMRSIEEFWFNTVCLPRQAYLV